MVAALCTWHEHHTRALAELDRRLDAGEHLVVAGPAAVETYAVLTRLPAPYRLSARDAQALIRANFLEGTDIVVLDGAGYRALLDRALALDVSGATVYDLVIAECARAAGADSLLTFNARHFHRVADDAFSVVVPDQAFQ